MLKDLPVWLFYFIMVVSTMIFVVDIASTFKAASYPSAVKRIFAMRILAPLFRSPEYTIAASKIVLMIGMCWLLGYLRLDAHMTYRELCYIALAIFLSISASTTSNISAIERLEVEDAMDPMFPKTA